ncbi:hypothetical protein [Streptomyces sp. YKOK-I1]
MITVPTIGQSGWGTVLNTALQSLDTTSSVARAGSKPADQLLVAWGYDSEHASSTNILASGTVYLHKLWIAAGSTVSNLGWTITTAGSTLTAGQSLMGLYSAAGTRLAVTADQASSWTSTGFKLPALTAPLSITTSAYYYVAILSVGTTPPTGASSPGLQTTFNANTTGANLRHAIGATGQTSLPSSITMSSNTSTGVSTWAVAA